MSISRNKHNEHLYERLKIGSAPKMEVTGSQRIFSRSIETNKLRYTEYYGDGDSKSFNEVENVYPGTVSCKERVYRTRTETCSDPITKTKEN